jgi:hypothetical protein
LKTVNTQEKYAGFFVGRSARDGSIINPINSKDQILDKPLAPQSGNSPHFMEPGSSLPFSKQSAAPPCPEPDQSSPFRHISLNSIIILFSHLRLSLPSGAFLPGFHTKTLHALIRAVMADSDYSDLNPCDVSL